MNSLDDSNDSDSELIGNNDSIIGEILIQMKSEFNKSVDSSIIKNKIVNNQVNTSESIDTAKDNCLPQESTVTEEFVTKSVTNISTRSIKNVENSLDKEVSNNIVNGNNQSKETTENGNKTNFVNNTEDKVVHIEHEEIVQRKTKAKINNTILSNRNEMHEEENELLTEDKNLTVREKKNASVCCYCSTYKINHIDLDKINQIDLDQPYKIKKNSSIKICCREDNIRPRCRSSLRNKLTVENPGLKRSSRRLSKDFGETVLQSAIARKEKSYNETVKPQRLSRRLKPKKLNNTETPPKSPRNKRRNSISEKIKSNDENNSNENISTSLENISLLPQSNENLSEIISENIDSDIKEKTPPKKNKNVKNLRLPKKNVEAVIDNAILTIENTSNQIESISNETENPSDTIDNKLSPEILENDNAIPLISLSAEAKKPLTRRKTSDSDSKNVLENALPTIVRRRSHRQTTSPQQVDQTDKLPPDPSKSPPAIPQLEGLKTCLCLKRTQIEIEISNENEMFCTAVDSVSGKCIGCNNMADISDIRRPSNRVPFLILCTVHFQRIIRHNCCPGCGMFCTEGAFICCKNGHQYHRECASIIDVTYEGQHLEERPLQCLHCGLIENQKEVQLIMKSSIKLAFLPFQRSYYPAAKMKIQYIEDDQYKMVEDNGYYLENDNYKKLSKLCTNKTDNGLLFTSEDLYEAAETGDIEKLSEIIASGIDLQQSIDSHDGDTALHAACTGGHKIAAYMLLVAGASVNVINNGQKTPLMNAILGFHEEMLYFLIKNGAKITFKGPDGMTALHLAAKIGFLNGCKILVASSNNDKQFIDEKDDGGWTPLVWACEHAHGDIARFLLWRGADPQIRDLEHNVPLHWAAFGGNYETIDLLLSLGVDVNAKNVHKESPLHIAARQDRYDCIIILLAHKAIPDYVNSDGETPLDCCGEKSQKCRDIISLNIQLRAMFSNVPSKDPVLAYDISNGKELNPIQCINSCDDEPKPSDFIYITENCITADIRIDRKVTTLQFCRCEDKCGTSSCQCNNISLRCWYDDQERLLPEFDYLDPPMIFECNQMCSCNTITCKNRVVQKGLTQRFQIFRTKTKGWGVKTLRFIKRGTYVCEYIGEILSDLEADQREDDSYLFDLDSRVCTIGYGILTKEGETYCIDARKYGNLARFINHHCSPNLLPVRVFIDHQDLHFPRIAFFANRDIAADEELGFDYGEKFWIIKCKSFTCTCGASNCRYSDATIESTLKVYQLREEQINLQQQQLLLQLNK